MPRIASFLWICFLLSLAIMGAACGSREEGKVRITDRVEAVNLDSASTALLDAECSTGEELIGGGYSIMEPPLDSGNPLIIEASFPFSGEVWRTVVTRPASFRQDRDGIPLAFSWATCASIPGDQLDTDVVASSQATPPTGGSFESVTTQATCPADSELTSGGFRVSPADNDRWDVAGLYNAWMWTSAPANDLRWGVTLRRIAGIQGPTPPSVRAYALCARTPIESSRLVENEAEKRDPTINFGYLDGVAECDSDEIATGGGYSFSGDPLVPHVVSTSTSQLLDGNWRIVATHGHQVGEGSGVLVTAVCVPIPVIVDVDIVSPRGEICTTCVTQVEYPVRVGLDPNDPQMSEPIEFSASATDGDGDPLTGNALVWTAYTDPAAAGFPLGTGESFTARLPAPPAGETTVGYLIKVVASDPDGNTGSDSVVVIVVAGA